MHLIFNKWFQKKIRSVIQATVDKQTTPLKNDAVSLKAAIGKLMGRQNLQWRRNEILSNIHNAEFQVFSQWGDDGIINFLVNYLDIPNKRFVEFGVENYKECNTRFLLINDNWSGLIMDGSEEYMEMVSNEEIYWRYDIKAVSAFITAENINQLLKENNFSGELGILSIDIDGNDYWIWKNIQVVDPIIVIVEYNSIFGFDNPWTVPYDASFVRCKKHYSNLYYGASLLSICDLATEKNYSFIGCNSNGNNAYFIRNDKLRDIKVQSPASGYVASKFAESRGTEGKLTFLRGNERLKLLAGMQVYNTRKNIIEDIK